MVRLGMGDSQMIRIPPSGFRRHSVRGLMQLLCGVAVLPGCATLTSLPVSWLEEKPEYVTPHQIIPVWSDTVLHQSGQKGARGCGGRIMFYPAEGKRAVRVDGSLVVYAWDESKQAEDRKPDRKYVFRANDLQKHYSKSKIGDSYSFWLPWDDAGGLHKELTLVARFVGRNGAEVTSAPAKVILAGAVPLPERIASGKTANGVKQVSHETSAPNRETQKIHPGLNTTEIHLTPGFTDRNLSNHHQAYTPDDLFSNATRQDATGNDDRASTGQIAAPDVLTTSDQDIILTPPAAPTAQPADRSLRFQDRVRTSREAQRSFGRVLSERYQSERRTAVWEKD